jgi:hypothetical protein
VTFACRNLGKPRKASVKIAGIRAEIGNLGLSITKQGCYPCNVHTDTAPQSGNLFDICIRKSSVFIWSMQALIDVLLRFRK